MVIFYTFLVVCCCGCCALRELGIPAPGTRQTPVLSVLNSCSCFHRWVLFWNSKLISWRLPKITWSWLGLGITTHLRQAGISSVWIPACQDVSPGVMRGWGCQHAWSPSIHEYFRLVYGHQGAEDDPEKLALTDQLLAAVLVRPTCAVLVSRSSWMRTSFLTLCCWLKVSRMGAGLIWKRLLRWDVEVDPTAHVPV